MRDGVRLRPRTQWPRASSKINDTLLFRPFYYSVLFRETVNDGNRKRKNKNHVFFTVTDARLKHAHLAPTIFAPATIIIVVITVSALLQLQMNCKNHKILVLFSLVQYNNIETAPDQRHQRWRHQDFYIKKANYGPSKIWKIQKKYRFLSRMDITPLFLP